MNARCDNLVAGVFYSKQPWRTGFRHWRVI
jgi:hypothetical protein